MEASKDVDVFLGFSDDLFREALDIVRVANEEYSGDDSAFTSNFDFVTVMMRLGGSKEFKPRQAALTYLMKSIFSIAKDHSNRQSMRSRYVDAINYLMFMAWMDENQHDVNLETAPTPLATVDDAMHLLHQVLEPDVYTVLDGIVNHGGTVEHIKEEIANNVPRGFAGTSLGIRTPLVKGEWDQMMYLLLAERTPRQEAHLSHLQAHFMMSGVEIIKEALTEDEEAVLPKLNREINENDIGYKEDIKRAIRNVLQQRMQAARNQNTNDLCPNLSGQDF